MSLVLRPERPEDREEILRLTYDAFMTLDYPGRQRLDEHFLLSMLYESGKGIAPLCFAAILDGRIAGHIFYSETGFTRPDGSKARTLTFGPLSVHPEHQRQGIGRALVTHTMDLARGLHFGAVLITGVPEYYPRLGFRRARAYGLTFPDGSAPDPFMAYELIPGYLEGGGVYDTWPEEYDRAEQDEAGYAAFDAAFQKKHAPGRLTLRPLFEADLALMERWLPLPHIAPWYTSPEDWLRELRLRHHEFSFIRHFIAQFEGRPIGFCQYYDCFDALAYESWDARWDAGRCRGRLYSIDYLIGEPDCLRRGFGREMILQLIGRLKEEGAGIIIARPDVENVSSRRALLSCGFQTWGEDLALYLNESGTPERKAGIGY